MQTNSKQPIHSFCKNCGQHLVGYKNASGLIKTECPKCGLRVVSKEMSRRHIVDDIYAPPGQVLIPDN